MVEKVTENKFLTEFDKTANIHNMIYSIRGRQVMLDKDLAKIYGVELKRLNEQVKRNIVRFPDNFRFQLTNDEDLILRSQIATLKNENGRGLHSKYLPYVFTEQGVSMLSAVLNSASAINVSVAIINAFVEMRHHIANNASHNNRLDILELKQLKNELRFNKIFKALENTDPLPQQGIFFDGQVFDAFVFVTGLIKSAEHSIILIDNYVDEQVLTLLSKKKKPVRVLIYTHRVSDHLKLAIKHFNEQFPSLKIKPFKRSHDRFLIIDKKEIYHIGASLKDLGKKWFAFSKLDINPSVILNEIQAVE